VETASYDLLALMKRSGCAVFAFGIESGSQDVLNAMHKKITWMQISPGCKKCETGRNFYPDQDFYAGVPWDTQHKSMAQTDSFCTELPLDYAQFAIATPYPGTKMFEEVKASYVMLRMTIMAHMKALCTLQPGIFALML
jgi:radical SAM superfamily enzyme YgiQ (UPF0313 family)